MKQVVINFIYFKHVNTFNIDSTLLPPPIWKINWRDIAIELKLVPPHPLQFVLLCSVICIQFFSALNDKSTNLFSSTAILSCANYSLNLHNLGSVFSSFKTTCTGILVHYALNVDDRFTCSGGRCYVGCYVLHLTVFSKWA